MSIIDKIGRKLRSIHKMRDAKKLLKGTVRTIEESGIVDTLTGTIDELEKYAIASSVRALAELIEEFNDDLPNYKEKVYDILDNLDVYLKRRLRG